MGTQLSQMRLRSLLDYDAETGRFIWMERPEKTRYDRAWNAKHASKPAGGIDFRGYHVIRVDRVLYGAHRLAWLYVTGEFPGEIDHINRDRADNRFSNLRACSHAENTRNTTLRKDNAAGLKGVHRHYDGRWRASIAHSGRRHHLGVYATPDEAHKAYCAAALSLHGLFASTGG